MTARVPEASQLIGVWELISVETPLADGNLDYPFGYEPVGTIIYMASGAMAVHIAGSDLAHGRIRAYAGDWKMEADRVVHLVEQSYEPDLRGVRLERRAEYDDDSGILIYRTVEAQGEGHPVVTWRRIV